MKKILLSLFACVVALGAFADTTVTFDVSSPSTFGLSAAGYLTDGQTVTSGDVTLTFGGTKMNRSYATYFLMYKSTSSKTTTLKVSTATGVVKSVEFDATFLINGSYTYDNGFSYVTSDLDSSSRPTKGVWTGECTDVTFNASLGNANLKTIKVTIGDAPVVFAPKVTPNGGTLYAGYNNTVTASSNTEGATVNYKAEGGEYAALPADGLTVPSSGTYSFQAVKDADKSAEVSCTYNVVTPTEAATPAALSTMETGAAIAPASWTIVANDDYNKYLFLGDNASKAVIPVKYTDSALSTAKAGQIVQNGWVAAYSKTGGATYDAYLSVAYGTLTLAENTAAVTPINATLTEALDASATPSYTLIKVSNVTVTKTANYNFTLTDSDGNELKSYEQWASYPTIDASKTYDVTGIIYTDGTTRYLYPVSATEHVTFDFTNPAAYGVTAPATGEQTKLNDGDKMVSDGITFTNVKNGVVQSIFGTLTYATNFTNTDGVIDLRVLNKTVVTVAAPEGKSIKKIVFTGSALGNAKTFDCGTYTVIDDNTAEWTGDDNTITITNGGDFYISTMTIITGDAAKVAYPVFSSTGDVLYEGVTTPKTITLTCATEGATIKYREQGATDWTDYVDGIQITKTCTIEAKAVLGEDESTVVTASYTVNPVTSIATFNEFNALSDGAMVATSGALPVIYHWCTTYYNIFICSDGENVIYVNDKNATITTQVPYGKKLAAGIAGLKHDAGYMNHKPDLQPLAGTVKVADDEPVEITPTETTITALATTPAYNKYLVLKGVKIAAYVNPSTGKTVANNYTLSDATESTLRLYNRYSLSTTSLEDVAYDIKGVLVNTGTMDQFYPTSIEKSTATGINAIEANSSSNAVYYNLQGMKTSAPQHGVFITNGKKVVVK